MRCKCFKNRMPRPAPSAAPSMSPGISAMTKLRPGPAVTTPKIGVQGGEWVVGDFRPGGRNRADQGRFAGIRKTEQPHIRNELQFQRELALFARQPQAGLAGSAVGARLEARVAPPAFAALGHQQRLAFDGQVAQLLAGIDIGHHGADRNGNVDIVAPVTGAIVAAAALAILASIRAGNAKVRQAYSCPRPL